MNIGESIKIFRKNSGLTQQQLADKSNISRSYLADVEKNRYNPSIDTLQKIATSLGVSVDVFLKDEAGTTTINENIQTSSLSLKEQDKLDKEAQEIVDNLRVSLSQNKEYLENEDYRVLEASIRSALETIKLKNKEKYTPKKFKE